MKHLIPLFLFCLLSVCGFGSRVMGQDSAESIAARLVDDGFENVRVSRLGHHIALTLEDNHYRGIYRGLAKALHLVSPEASLRDTIQMVVLSEQSPRLTLHATHVGGQWLVKAEYGGHIPDELRHQPIQSSSLGRVDLVLYPRINFGNYMLDRFWCVAFYLSPAVEVALWPGAKLTAQLDVLAYDNYPNSNFKHLLPGIVSLQQQLVHSRRWDLQASLGIYNMERNGLDLRGNLHVTRNFNLGMILGATGPWFMEGHKPVLCNWDMLNALVQADYYESRSRLNLNVKAGRFLFEQWGAQAELYRHFHERAVGVYGRINENNTEVGFRMSTTIGSKKLGKRRAVRVRLPESFYLSYGEVVDGTREGLSSNAPVYLISPDESHATSYWQPVLIEQMVQQYLDGDEY